MSEYLKLRGVGGEGGKLFCGRLEVHVHGVALPVRHIRVGSVLQHYGEVVSGRNFMLLLRLGYISCVGLMELDHRYVFYLCPALRAGVRYII